MKSVFNYFKTNNMDIDKMIEQWEEKHSSLLAEYSKGNANNEVMQMYRSQMKNVLDFINQLKQVKNCFIPAVVGRSEQLVCDKCKHPVEHDGEGVWCEKCQTYTYD